MIYRKSRAFGKTGAGTSDKESTTLLIFFEFFEIVCGKFCKNFFLKITLQSEFRAKSYARFKEDPPYQVRIRFLMWSKPNRMAAADDGLQGITRLN